MANGQTFTVRVTEQGWVALLCPTCAIDIIVRKSFLAVKKQNHAHIWCPNGHQLQFLNNLSGHQPEFSNKE